MDVECDYPGCKNHIRVLIKILAVYCPLHIKKEKSGDSQAKPAGFKDVPTEMAHYPKYNKNGKKICDVSLCRKRSGLKQNGAFFYCGKHQKQPPLFFNHEVLSKKESVERLKSSQSTCDAVACYKTKTIHKYQGNFCSKHLVELGKIRMNKALSLSLNDEINWRNKEIALRKYPHSGHIEYVLRLVRRTKWVSCSSPS